MRFVIIASERTGSTHLVTTLGAHPEIFCNGNVFKHNKVQAFWPKEHFGGPTRRELLALREADPLAFLERIYSTNFGRPHVGFKIFGGQNDEVLHHLIRDTSVRKIVLFRRNVLANYSSLRAARESREYTALSGAQTSAAKVVFEENRFRSFHDDYVWFYRSVIDALNASRQIFYFANYEDINNPSLSSALTNFIGADPFAEINEKERYKMLVKQNPNDILSRFSDPEAVEAFLKNHAQL